MLRTDQKKKKSLECQCGDLSDGQELIAGTAFVTKPGLHLDSMASSLHAPKGTATNSVGLLGKDNMKESRKLT